MPRALSSFLLAIASLAACSSPSSPTAPPDTPDASHGTSPPVPTCTGTPPGCFIFTDVSLCEEDVGCAWIDGSCTGVVSPCSTLATEAQCTIEGCVWSGVASPGNPVTIDAGLPEPVDAGDPFTFEAGAPAGFDAAPPTASCSGIGMDCFDAFDDFTCDEILGCYWTVGTGGTSGTCGGESSPCSEISEELQCSEQGCVWSE